MKTAEERERAGWPDFEECNAPLKLVEKWAAKKAYEIEVDRWHNFAFLNQGRYPAHDWEINGEAYMDSWLWDEIVKDGLTKIFDTVPEAYLFNCHLRNYQPDSDTSLNAEDATSPYASEHRGGQSWRLSDFIS